MNAVRQLHAEHALLPGGWARDVLIGWDADGVLQQVQPQLPAPAAAERAGGPVVPGMPNLHSHAFQRAFAGLAERRDPLGAGDTFWSWRSRMYHFCGALTPQRLEDTATWVYLEMLEAGYTSVCEFHYVHHEADGRPYADDATLSRCLLRAAQRVGIGLTLLPVLYQTAGFDGAGLLAEQRRFARSTDGILALLQALSADAQASGARLGLAPHSLRAVPPDSLRESVTALRAWDPGAPIHIHIAEQAREVDDCIAARGARPVQWLLDHAAVDAHWCLVHATHMTADECRRAAASAAVAGLCPSTEANLGDGLFDLPRWRDAGGAWGIGSDSHVCVNAAEELLLLEYGQRLTRRQRNVLATPVQPDTATAMVLQACAGGAQAAGRPVGGLAVGQRADWVVLDAQAVALAELAPADMLSAHVFSSHRTGTVRDVWVGGQQRVVCGRHLLHEPAAAAFVRTRSRWLAASGATPTGTPPEEKSS